MTTDFGQAANSALIRRLISVTDRGRGTAALSGEDAVEWLADMDSGRTSSESLVRQCLGRMLTWEDSLNAMISLDPSALEAARECDRLRAAGCRKKLLGLPVVVKDNIDVAGFPTTMGAAALADSGIKGDAFLVRQLRLAGAVILGKASLSEYASDGMSANSLTGQVHNPYDLTRTPGGSSGGSGVAVAVEYAAAGIGTDGVNSIRSPASANSLIGLRPTKGLVSCAGASPSSRTQDMCGILARSARDAALFLSVIARYDPRDPDSIDAGGHDYLAGLDSCALSGKKIALLRNDCGADPLVLAVVDATVRRLRGLGAEVVELCSQTLDAARMLREDNVIRYEQKQAIDSWLADPQNGYKVKSLAQYLDTGLVPPAIAATLRSEFEPRYADRDAYRQRLARIKQDRDCALRLMRDEGIDAFCYPSQTIPVVPVGAPGGQAGRNGILASALGLPAVAFPGGYTQPTASAPAGVPIGMEFMGAPLSEQTLLNMVHSCETAVSVRQAPPISLLQAAQKTDQSQS